MQNQSNQLPATIPQYAYPEDEISLIDLWLSIARQKKVFWYVFSAILVISLISSILIPVKYTLSSTIAIGRIVQNDKRVLIESPATVKAKLDNALIPKILNEYQDENIQIAEIDVITPKNSELVVIETKVKEGEVEVFSKVLSNMTEAIQQDHEKIIGPTKSRINSTIQQKEKELENEQMDGFIEPVTMSKESETKIEHDVQKQLNDLEVTRIEWQAFQKEQKIDELKQEIADLKYQLDSITDTRAVTQPIRSQKPAGISKTIIVISGGALAIFMGLFGAFIAEFVTKVREYKEHAIKP